MKKLSHHLALGALILVGGVLSVARPAGAAAFTQGDLVVYRVGDGTQVLANTGNSVFLDEYSPAGVLVQSIAVPTTAGAAGTNQSLIASGTATSEGQINLSGNGQSLTFAGYNAPIGNGGTSLTGTAGATVNRTVGTVGATGVVNTVSTFSDFATGNNPRATYSPDGTSVYLVGGAGGIRYGLLGATAATSTQLSTTTTNLRDVGVSNGQLYVTSSSGTTRIATVGTGTPTTTGQTITNLPGISTTNSTSPYAFAFATLTLGGTTPDTLYVADDTTTTGGIQKFSLVGGNWTLNGNIAAAGTVRALTLSVGVNGAINLFGSTGGSLVSYTDTAGFNAAPGGGTLTTIATAATNEAFRGIAFAPVAVPEPSTYALLAVGGFALVVLARRRAVPARQA